MGLLGISSVVDFYVRKRRLQAHNIRGLGESNRIKDFFKFHPTEDWRAEYSIESVDLRLITISRPGIDGDLIGVTYTMERSTIPCYGDKCKVKCKSCPKKLCAHMYSCSCVEFARNALCKHAHILDQFLAENDLEVPPLREVKVIFNSLNL